MSTQVTISKKLVIINSASSVATRLLSIAAIIWVQQYLLKHIPVDEYSLLPVIYSLMIFLPIFSEILAGGIKRYVTEVHSINNPAKITKIVSTMFPPLCLAAFTLLGIGGLLAWHIDFIINISPEYVSQARSMLLMIVVLEALRLPAKAFSSGLFATQRFVLENLISISCEILRIIVMVVLLTQVNPSITHVVVATFAAGLLEISLLFIASRKLLPTQIFRPASFDMSILKEMIHFGGWSSVYGMAGMARKSSDPLILNRLATPMDVACFNLGALVPNRLEMITNQSFLGSVLPQVIAMNAHNQKDKIKSVYLRVGRYGLWGIMLICTPLIVFHKQIVELYVGDAYAQAGYVLVLLLACYPFLYGNILYTVLANAKNQMKPLAIREFISVIANICLTILFVSHYNMGAIGSATATFICYGIGSIFIYWPFGKSMVNASWQEIFRNIIAPGVLPFAIFLSTLFFINNANPAKSWFDIFSYSALGSLIYFIAIWFASLDSDRAQAIDLISTLRKRFS